MTTRQQFFTQKQRKRLYKTLEIFHPDIGVTRLVSGRIDPKDFTLESGAPRNAGQTVTFTGGSFEWSQPDQNESYVQTDIQLGRIASQIKQQLKLIRGQGRAKPADVVLREYIAGEESAPAYALRLFVSTITLTQEGAVIRAAQDNPADLPVHRLFTPDDFPGLAETL